MAGCAYLSDLRWMQPEGLLGAVKAIPEEAFSDREWALAWAYLACGELCSSRAALLKWLEEKRSKQV